MKRLITLIACVFVLAAFPAVSAWAIWEGNAGIAAASEFPGKGMFARSDMFPKNTVVVIENLETGISVKAIITGSSGVSGLVAVLSPETASALNIKSGSVSRVRISIPSVVSESGATGVSVNEGASSNLDPDVNPAVAAASAPAIPLESIAGTQENPLVPLDGESLGSGDNAAIAAADENAVMAPENAGMDEIADNGGTAPLPAAVAASESSETTDESPVEGTADGGEGNAVAEADAGIPPESSSVLAIAQPPEPAADAIDAVDTTDAVGDSGDQVDSSIFYDEPEIVATTDSVALVPTELNPPVEPIGESAASSVVPAITENPVESDSMVSAVVSLATVTAIGKGSYYVQIASYSDPVSAKKIVDEYGMKYPIVVEKTTVKSGDILKVCIGPVKKDEFGAVLERFKSLGFRDAFVRKGM